MNEKKTHSGSARVMVFTFSIREREGTFMIYSSNFTACAALVLTVASLSLVAHPASAKPPGARPIVVVVDPDTVTRRISYADLNLAVAPGELTLSRRVSGAINSLCSDATGGMDGSYVTNLSRMRCKSTAWSQARPQMANAVQQGREAALTGRSVLAANAIIITLAK